MEITLDTHSLLWYLDENLNNKLSEKAFNAIKKAEEHGIIYISIITLVEILYLIEKGRISYSFNFILKTLEESEIYCIIPLDINVLQEIENLKGLETHDRIILSTAKATNSILISKDETIRNNYQETLW
jgi:PIN domain nuclease of toxin-antitoxin system